RLLRRVGLSEQHLKERAVASFLRQFGDEVVLGEYLDYFVRFVPLLDRMRLPYVVQGHGIDVSASLRNFAMAHQYSAYRSARGILTRSEFHRRRLIDLGLPAEKVRVNRGGVDVRAEMPKRGPESAKRFLALARPSSDPCAARLHQFNAQD